LEVQTRLLSQSEFSLQPAAIPARFGESLLHPEPTTPTMAEAIKKTLV
jgi:hypothetical protein